MLEVAQGPIRGREILVYEFALFSRKGFAEGIVFRFIDADDGCLLILKIGLSNVCKFRIEFRGMVSLLDEVA